MKILHMKKGRHTHTKPQLILHLVCGSLWNPKNSLSPQHDRIGNQHSGVIPIAEQCKPLNGGHSQEEAVVESNLSAKFMKH